MQFQNTGMSDISLVRPFDLSASRSYVATSVKVPQVKLVKGKLQLQSSRSIGPRSWKDNTPRRLLDKTGTALVVHLPSFLLPETVVRNILFSVIAVLIMTK